jgi:hypothetical protein
MLKKNIEMNDRLAISLRINAALTGHITGDKHKKGLSHGGVKRWIQGIDDNPVWEEDEYRKGEPLYDANMNQSITALQLH